MYSTSPHTMLHVLSVISRFRSSCMAIFRTEISWLVHWKQRWILQNCRILIFRCSSSSERQELAGRKPPPICAKQSVSADLSVQFWFFWYFTYSIHSRSRRNNCGDMLSRSPTPQKKKTSFTSTIILISLHVEFKCSGDVERHGLRELAQLLKLRE
jgi:hypothetical protein